MMKVQVNFSFLYKIKSPSKNASLLTFMQTRWILNLKVIASWPLHDKRWGKISKRIQISLRNFHTLSQKRSFEIFFVFSFLNICSQLLFKVVTHIHFRIFHVTIFPLSTLYIQLPTVSMDEKKIISFHSTFWKYGIFAVMLIKYTYWYFTLININQFKRV